MSGSGVFVCTDLLSHADLIGADAHALVDEHKGVHLQVVVCPNQRRLETSGIYLVSVVVHSEPSACCEFCKSLGARLELEVKHNVESRQPKI